MAENSIKPLISEAIKTSMKSGDKENTTTLRMAISEIKKEEIDKKSDLTDQEIITILQKMIKQRKDSSSQFSSAGREELAEKEEREIKSLNEFLPEQLTEEEIEKLVSKTINDLNVQSIQDIGKVMGSLKSQLQGKADMSIVSRIVKQNLSE
ncbi:MAG: GatB/YqeY domain-containing protein [Gammaproteobacteria bacterium]|mgnify:FL=1|nr:MAG: GatB/YqeY domain-containing protein [Gammaproteobacteria bacterium]|tara:strand:+ start:410 stop:865 length:456 start_codon:yes stop_codon:yes gene_type:complete